MLQTEISLAVDAGFKNSKIDFLYIMSNSQVSTFVHTITFKILANSGIE